MSMDSSISGMSTVANMAQTLALVDIPVDIQPIGKLVPWDIFGSMPYELKIGRFTKPDGTKMVLEEHYLNTSGDDDWYCVNIGVSAYPDGQRPDLPGEDRTITKEELEAQLRAEQKEFDDWYASLDPEDQVVYDEGLAG